MKFLSVFFLFAVFVGNAQDQSVIDSLEKEYNMRIKKTRINGVYIPKDLDEAYNEFIRLSDPEGVLKFKNAPEDTVARKLHFGLGQWFALKWSFYDGSRFSHYLREKGLSYPDDMIDLCIRIFHRRLNNKDLYIDSSISKYASKRAEEFKKEKLEGKLIETIKQPKPK